MAVAARLACRQPGPKRRTVSDKNGYNNLVMSGSPKELRVGAAEFKSRCLELIDHVCDARAEYLVTRHGRPVARLVPVVPEAPASPLGSMRGTLLRYDRPFDPVPAAWSLDRSDAE